MRISRTKPRRANPSEVAESNVVILNYLEGRPAKFRILNYLEGRPAKLRILNYLVGQPTKFLNLFGNRATRN